MTTSRVDRLRSIIAGQHLDGVLIQKPENRRYLTGFTGSAGSVLATPMETVLFVDFRYLEQASQEASGFEVIKVGRQLDELVGAVKTRELKRMGFESDGLTYQQHREYTQRLAPTELVPVDGIDQLRWVKEPDELRFIKKAVEIGDTAFAHIQGYLRPGAVERDVANELEFFMRRNGAEKEAFESIVASGPRSSRPHGYASDRAMTRGDFVTLDFGALYRGYTSDCTRTVVLSEASRRQREIYQIVLDAHHAALEGIKPGITAKEADALARNLIAKAGYAEAFGHGLGHGIGLAVHEGPILSPREEAVLQPGMVVTVEPGIYLAEWGGVRIEDLVVITERGCQSFTAAPKELRIL